jgi:hypothetical protein
MKPFVTVALLAFAVMLHGTGAFAGADFGPPKPFGERGQMSLGLGYHYYSADWKNDIPEVPISEYMRSLFYLQVSYAFVTDWEAYARLGFADAKFKRAYPFDHRFDFKDGYKAAAGFGLRGLVTDGKWQVGPHLQGHFYSSYDHLEEGQVNDEYASARPIYDDIWDLAAGVGFAYDTGFAILSLTPYLYWSRGKATVELTTEGETDIYTSDLEQENVLGGMFGAFMPLGNGFNMNIETQYQSGFSFSISITETLAGK